MWIGRWNMSIDGGIVDGWTTGPWVMSNVDVIPE